MKKLNITRWLSLIIGILLIVSGGLSLLMPLTTTVSILQFISFMLIAIGLLKIFRYFSNEMFRVGSFLIAGIVDILVGILMFRNIAASMDVFRILIGFWILLVGITEIATSIDLKHMELKRWWLGFISGGLGIILGFALITNVAYFVVYMSIMFSMYMIILGINFISTFSSLTKLKRFFKD